MSNFTLPEIRLNRRAFTRFAVFGALFAHNVVTATPLYADGTSANMDFANPSKIVELLNEAVGTQVGLASVMFAAYSRADTIAPGVKEYANIGLRASMANVFRIIYESTCSLVLKAMGKTVSATDFAPMVDAEIAVVATAAGRKVYNTLRGTTGEVTEAVISTQGAELYNLYFSKTGKKYPFHGSPYAAQVGSNNATLPEAVAALNFAIANMSDEAKAKYSKPEVVAAGHKRDMAAILNLRNAPAVGNLILLPGLFADVGVFQGKTEVDIDIENKVWEFTASSWVADKTGVRRMITVQAKSIHFDNDKDYIKFSVDFQNVILPYIFQLMANGNTVAIG